jgi:DNA-binding PadR family transcriptional regulator
VNRRDRIYQRTDSGRKAWQDENSGLPPAYRGILGLIDHPTPSGEIVNGMFPDSEGQVLAWLDELESLGFVACSTVALGAEGYEPVRRQVALSAT